MVAFKQSRATAQGRVAPAFGSACIRCVAVAVLQPIPWALVGASP